MTLSQKKGWSIGIATAFAVLHYALTAYVFFLMAAYAGDIDGLNPPLTALQDSLLTKAFFVTLFPFGYAPFGVLFNSAVLGYGVYRLLVWKFRSKETS